MAATTKPTTPACVFTDNSICIGFVLTRGPQGYEAFNADAVSLGTYTSQIDAAAAVSASAANAVFAAT
jgi:hypothetical protein